MRIFRVLFIIVVIFLITPGFLLISGQTQIEAPSGKNLAIVATPSGSSRYGASMNSLNDGLVPATTGRMRTGRSRQPQRLSTQWVQYDWSRAISGLAAKHGATAVPTYSACNGPNGDEAIPADYLLPTDSFHFSEVGHKMAADLHRAVGYDHGP